MALAVALIGTTGVIASQATAGLPDSTDYKIQNVNSGMVLGISGGSEANGGKVAQWPDENPNTNQIWRISDRSPRTLENYQSGKLMGVVGQSRSNWANIVQWTASGNNDQRWLFENIGAGLIQIRNVNSNKCLAIPNASTARNVQAVQYTCNGGRDQQWRLIYIR